MKNGITLTALSLLVAAQVGAQTIYDAANIAGKELNGTARFVGMGGAMSALGGEISTIGTNPAGVGIYRSNDMMTSFGFSTYNTESSFDGATLKSNLVRGSFDNIGIVLSSKVGNQTALRYVNFGFNYKRAKSFNRNMNVEGRIGANSQTYQMASQANGITGWGDSPYTDDQIGWLSALGYNSYLIDLTDPDKGSYVGMYDNANTIFRSEERGGIDQYDFNVSFNFNDRVYLGATVGTYVVDYRKYSFYDENYVEQGEGYNIQSWNKVQGSGFDLKLGLIARPFAESPLRVGLSIHTPTFYALELATSARVESDVWDDKTGTVKAYDVDTYDQLDGREMVRDFNMHTPWLYNVSLGYTVGKSLALGAEYEYQDYSSMRFNEPGGYQMRFETGTVKDFLKGVHTWRLGAEYKVIPEFAMRVGYNYTTTAFGNDAYKALPENSINTDTDFSNTKGINNYTLGMGYRGTWFYADLAYKLSSYKADFYAFDSMNLAKTDVTNTRNQVLLTLGVRF